MVLGKLQGHPYLDKSRARAYCACSRCGWGLFGRFFSHLSFLSSFSLSPWETARYRLKYCLKGPLSPKQPTNQPFPVTHLLLADSLPVANRPRSGFEPATFFTEPNCSKHWTTVLLRKLNTAKGADSSRGKALLYSDLGLHCLHFGCITALL